MQARLTTIKVRPDQVDEAVRLWQDSVLPAAQRQPGFRGAMMLSDRATGKNLVIGLWGTEADLSASGEGSDYLREQLAKFVRQLGVSPIVENYEVSAQG